MILASKKWQLETFLKDYPFMKVRPALGDAFCIAGAFAFSAEHKGEGQISDSFRLQILVSSNYPKDLPLVRETDGRIPGPRHPDQKKFHVNSDGTLCLGSPLRLKLALGRNPTLNQFAEKCLIPYLFAVSRKLETGGDLVFGELAHGSEGILADYAELFSLPSKQQILHALRLLGMKKREANKHPCPCHCGRRLGRCTYRFRLNNLREIGGRASFQTELVNLS